MVVAIIGVAGVMAITLPKIFVSNPESTPSNQSPIPPSNQSPVPEYSDFASGVTGPLMLWPEQEDTPSPRPMIYSKYVSTKAPTIDGVLAPEEWPEPALTKTFGYTIKGINKTGNIAAYFMNDDSSLYFAMTARAQDFKASFFMKDITYLDLDLYFDGNGDGVIGIGDDSRLFTIGATNFSWEEGKWEGKVSWISQYGDLHLCQEGWWESDTTTNGKGAATLADDTGTLTFECLIPLDSGDPEDLSAKPGDTVSARIELSQYRDKSSDLSGCLGYDVWPAGGGSFDIKSYSKLVLAVGPSFHQ
jgi:hypothetical protein